MLSQYTAWQKGIQFSFRYMHVHHKLTVLTKETDQRGAINRQIKDGSTPGAYSEHVNSSVGKTMSHTSSGDL